MLKVVIRLLIQNCPAKKLEILFYGVPNALIITDLAPSGMQELICLPATRNPLFTKKDTRISPFGTSIIDRKSGNQAIVSNRITVHCIRISSPC